MKRILYIANVRVPNERAHGIQILKTCESLARAGMEVHLIVPNRRTAMSDDPFAYYGVAKIFKISRLFCIDLVSLGKAGALIESASFAVSAFLFARRHPDHVVYSRDKLPLLLVSLLQRPSFWESHRGEFNRLVRALFRRISGLVVISDGLRDFYVEKGFEPARVLVARDGVDVAQFDLPLSKHEARLKLDLPPDAKLVVYSGSLYDWKGTDVLLRAAPALPPDTKVLIVGGSETQLRKFRSSYDSTRIIFMGMRPYRDIPLFLKAADVLVLTGSASHTLSSRFTSPMKLFEYMAASRPIVASDLPSFREVLDEQSALFAKAGDAKALAAAIAELLLHPGRSATISTHARAMAARYSWDARGVSIQRFIEGA